MVNPLRKDLKIRGTIGEAGQKDTLIYVSLVHQIKQAKPMGYIIQAKRSLMHFQQQNGHDLCSTVSAILQFHEETVYSFVIRCLESRQKILFFSGKPDDLNYTPQFVSKLFLRTLEKGIKSPFIAQEIKHLLRADNVCGQNLLAAVMRASTYEHERTTLQPQGSKKISKVHEASSNENSKAKQDGSVSKLVTVVESLSSQLTSLKQDFQD